MNKYLNRLMIIILSATLLNGCGFRLKGDYQLPASLKQLHLQSPDQYGELTRLVKNKLRRYQVTLGDDPKLPVLQLDNDRLERGTLSLFSSGQVAEYELTYHLEYRLIHQDQQPQTFTIKLRRDYLDDPRSAQAKSREMELMLKEMRLQAAEQIVRQLSKLQ
ncbi:MAG: hypothetical protein HRU24_04085 [Gammaproteobacteria bacterium]|nr:hypothetical protein [Gammaproteobacteria bacterium]